MSDINEINEAVEAHIRRDAELRGLLNEVETTWSERKAGPWWRRRMVYEVLVGDTVMEVPNRDVAIALVTRMAIMLEVGGRKAYNLGFGHGEEAASV